MTAPSNNVYESLSLFPLFENFFTLTHTVALPPIVLFYFLPNTIRNVLFIYLLDYGLTTLEWQFEKGRDLAIIPPGPNSTPGTQ